MKELLEKISAIITKIWTVMIIITIIITVQLVFGWDKPLSHPVNIYSLHGYQIRSDIHRKIETELNFHEYKKILLESIIFEKSTPSYWLYDGGGIIQKLKTL